ncbi:MAG: Crp/Fnr family transcriptional regulator [Acetobacteraceae bacterium]
MPLGEMGAEVPPQGGFVPRSAGPSKPALFLTETVVQIAEQANILGRLSPEDEKEVRAAAQALTVSHGAAVFRQGDPHSGIFLIESGTVRSYYTGPSGREITLAYWPAGHFVGGPEIFGSGSHVWSGDAVGECRLLKVGGPSLRRLMERIPALALGLVEGLVQKGKCYSALVQMLGTRSVIERLAQLLLILAATDGKSTAAGVLIDRVMTHEELAQLVGATRQWITMTLDRFRKQGVIELAGRYIVLLDVPYLEGIGQ